ncbi:MAG TPA: tail fiber protein [Xanthobacteraceae bacterium]|jgi:microcystin-dependent protein
MSQAYVGEIRCFGFNFAPYQWAQCNGQVMAISQNAALFSILGTYYGGNGTTTFALPNLQGGIPMHWGSGPGLPTTTVGETMGSTQVTLNLNEIPQHNHVVSSATRGSAAEAAPLPTSTSFISNAKGAEIYQAPPVTTNAPFSQKAISQTGGGQSHNNMQPYLALNFCIALYGNFPPRS